MNVVQHERFDEKDKLMPSGITLSQKTLKHMSDEERMSNDLTKIGNDDTTGKRVREKSEADDDYLSPEEFSKLSRSERKRHREKKRRSDVNKGFDELMNLLLEIDPSVRAEAEERARRGQWKGNFGAQEDNLLSRVDLISRTVDVLRRVHRENEERKQIIATLTGTPTSGTSASAKNSVKASEQSLIRPTQKTENALGIQAAVARNQLLQPLSQSPLMVQLQQPRANMAELPAIDPRLLTGLFGGQPHVLLPTQSMQGDLRGYVGGRMPMDSSLHSALSMNAPAPCNDQDPLARRYLQMLKEQDSSILARLRRDSGGGH